MKPIQLIMSAFGSYAGEEKIEFDSQQSGLFLITGDTGAGKTTIFDAIMYALYDDTSGGNRNGNMMRSQYADNTVPTFVSFSFRYGNNEYCVRRNPEYIRESRRRNADGSVRYTTEKSGVSLIMPDGSEYIGRQRDINRKIVEIIGLDARQFCQVAMIAQGEFMRLLYADSEERRIIFSKIFKTDTYRSMQQSLWQKNKEIQEKLADNARSIKQYLENVNTDEKWKEQIRTQLSKNEPPVREIELLMSRIIDEQQGVIADNDSAKAQCRKEFEEVNAMLATAVQNNGLLTQLDMALSEQEELTAMSIQMNEVRQRIRMAQNALQVMPLEQRLNKSRQQLDQSAANECEIQLQLDKCRQELDTAQENHIQAESRRDTELPKLRRETIIIEEMLPRYKQLEAVEVQKEQQFIMLQGALKELEEKEAQLAELSSVQSELEQFRNDNMECGALCEKLKADEHRLSDSVEEIQNILEHIQRRAKCDEILRKCVEDYELAQVQCRKAYELYEQYDSIYMHEQAGIIAAEHLHEGEPCPVCGALEHPHPAKRSYEDITQERVRNARLESTKADDIRHQAGEALLKASTEHKKESEWIEEALNRLDIGEEELAGRREFICGQLKQCRQQLDAQNIILIKYRDNEEQLAKLLAERSRITEEAEQIRKLADRYRQQDITYDEQIKVMKKDLRLANEREAQETLSRLKTECVTIESEFSSANARLLECAQELAKTEGRARNEAAKREELMASYDEDYNLYIAALNENGFAAEEEYAASKLTKQELAAQSDAIEKYGQQCAANADRLELLRKQTIGLTRIDTQQLESRQEELYTREKQLTQRYNANYSNLQGNLAALEQIKKSADIRSGLKEKYSVINTLYATACGRLSGAVKMDFETYVLRHYFQRIINAANNRLTKMNDGQWQLKCKDIKELSNQGSTGLNLDIYSAVTDSVRDIKTLSGGEAFMAALAMALGMADIVQNQAGAIQLDTMFIDEGFGSLDEYSREQAIRILNELAGKRRMIGIISHVTELKEQIDCKLIVSKTAKGSCTQWSR